MRPGRIACALVVATLASGCSTRAALHLTAGGRQAPLAAYHSFFAELEHVAPEYFLLVTFVDPAFSCTGPVGGLDALSFSFADPAPGATSSTVLARAGPRFGSATGGTGSITLRSVDVNLPAVDGGAVVVDAGGRVSGDARYRLDGTIGPIDIEGSFDAPHCAALDFLAAP
jgi:hypothetical protein